jgi:small subunit ribosomal protein S2
LDTQTTQEDTPTTFELPEVSVKTLLEAGAHFGHQQYRWNPKMKRYVFEKRHGLYIIDLAKTMTQIRHAMEVVKQTVRNQKSILFVGTKKQAKDVIREYAEQCEEFYVCERWPGGLLTNLTTIRQSVKKMERYEKKLSTGTEGLKKKEISKLEKDLGKLNRNLSGIRSMRKIPGLVVVVDPNKEHIAVAEANKLGIPVMALVDTNCDPDPIKHVIACNDDALKSIRLIVGALTKAINDEKSERRLAFDKGDASETKKKFSKDDKRAAAAKALANEELSKKSSETVTKEEG